MALPQYTYDPVTQTYIPAQQPMDQQPSQSRGLYDLNTLGGDAMPPAPPGPNDARFSMSPFATEVAVNAQNFGQMHKGTTFGLPNLMVSPVMSLVSMGAEALANRALKSEVNPVPNPTMPVVTAINPTAQLAAMNQAGDAETEDEGPEGIVSVGPLSMVSAEDVAAMADAAAVAGQTAGTTSEGGGTTSEGGPSGPSGVGDESGHAADGNNSGGGGGGGDPDGNGTGPGGGWYKGGQIMNYQGGGYATPNPYIYNQPHMMAEGGLAAAKRTQDAGRGPDTMLVHMAPQEVAGLQALAMAHGGSLTINPKTGLPEAGFLSSLLPTLVGAALTIGSQGAINPYMAAAIVGGGTTLATGSLKKGLFAGLGAFGGGNIGEGLSAAAGTELVTPATPAVSPATQITPDIAQPGAQFIEPPDATFFSRSSTPLLESTGRGPFAGVNSQYNVIPTETYETVISPVSDQAGQFIVDRPPMAGASNWQSTVVPEAGRMPPVENARDALLARGEPMQVATYGGPTNFERAGKGLQNIFAGGEEGKAARTLFGEKAGYGSFSAAASPILNAEPEPLAKKKSYIRPYDLNVVNRSAENAPLYGPGSTSGREMVSYNFSPRPIYEAAGGGLMSLRNGGSFDDEPGSDGYAAGGLTAFAAGKEVKRPKKLGGDPYYKFSHSRKDTSMEAALDANFAKGGGPRYLNGKGDGMSDSIPAIIDGKQPARLADGEFVIPADVVSHLGNGSSKAGAKKLYAMMDRIRKVRTGKKSQAPEVKSERYMPA